MQKNELINDLLGSLILINLSSYSLKGTASSSYYRKFFKEAVTNVWISVECSGMVHVVDYIPSKSVWRCLPVKTNCKSTDQFHYATNIQWNVFQTKVSDDSGIYNQKELSPIRLQACAYSLIK